MIRGMKFVSIPVRNQDASLKLFTENSVSKSVPINPLVKSSAGSNS